MSTSIICRAKNPETCKYHNPASTLTRREQKLATLMEDAANDFDFERYHKYHLELDAMQGKVTLHDISSGLTEPLPEDLDDDPHGDDANLSEHGRYTATYGRVNWRTFTDLTVAEQEEAGSLARLEDDMQRQMAEYGTPETLDLLSRIGGKWVTERSWEALLNHYNEFLDANIVKNPDAPDHIRTRAQQHLDEHRNRY